MKDLHNYELLLLFRERIRPIFRKYGKKVLRTLQILKKFLVLTIHTMKPLMTLRTPTKKVALMPKIPVFLILQISSKKALLML